MSSVVSNNYSIYVPPELVNHIGEYLPLPEHRLLQRLICPKNEKRFTTDKINTLINNLNWVIMQQVPAARPSYHINWGDVFRGKVKVLGWLAMNDILSQQWMIDYCIPIYTIPEHKLMFGEEEIMRFIGVPFFKWKDIKILAQNASLDVFYDKRCGITLESKYSPKDHEKLTDSQAEEKIRKLVYEKNNYNYYGISWLTKVDNPPPDDPIRTRLFPIPE